jgi:hypothetical protein
MFALTALSALYDAFGFGAVYNLVEIVFLRNEIVDMIRLPSNTGSKAIKASLSITL